MVEDSFLGHSPSVTPIPIGNHRHCSNTVCLVHLHVLSTAERNAMIANVIRVTAVTQ